MPVLRAWRTRSAGRWCVSGCVRNAINRLQGKKAIVAKKSPGFGTYVAIGAGVLAALAVAYAVWQTFRADDELWVTEDDIDAVN